MDEPTTTRPRWGLWQLNPRFYRRPLRPPVYQELYWICGFEIGATIALAVVIYYLSIAPGRERQRLKMEVYMKSRDLPTPVRTSDDRSGR